VPDLLLEITAVVTSAIALLGGAALRFISRIKGGPSAEPTTHLSTADERRNHEMPERNTSRFLAPAGVGLTVVVLLTLATNRDVVGSSLLVIALALVTAGLAVYAYATASTGERVQARFAAAPLWAVYAVSVLTLLTVALWIGQDVARYGDRAQAATNRLSPLLQERDLLKAERIHLEMRITNLRMSQTWLRDKVETAQSLARQAESAAICELDGTCGTGVPGVSETYRERARIVDRAREDLANAEADLERVDRELTASLEELTVVENQAVPINQRLAREGYDDMSDTSYLISSPVPLVGGILTIGSIILIVARTRRRRVISELDDQT
jgi:hypothetical protein